MNFKKMVAALTAAALLAIPMAGCGTNNGGSSAAGSGAAGSAKPAEVKKEVTLWATGSDNVRQIFETLTADFNKNSEYAGKYEVKLQFMLSGTGTQTLTDMLVASSKAGQTNTDYDIVDLSGDDLSKVYDLLGEPAFTKLDNSKIPNNATVSAKAADAPEYAQPYRGTTVVLAYNSEKVPNPPKTTDELVEWIKANPGRFAYNVPGTGGAGDSFARTAVYNQIDDPTALTSSDEKWVGQWDKGFAFLKELHPYLYQSGGSVVYPNKNQGSLDLLAQGEIDMCPNWADMVLSQRAAGTIPASIKIATIEPSFTGSVQSLIIPTFGSNPEGAYAFMNYMLSEQAQSIMVKQMAAIPLIDVKNMDMTGYEDLKGLDVSNFRIMSIGDLKTQFNERWDNEIATLK